MADARRRIAWTLSRLAQALPPAERQGFRAFLARLPGAAPRRRKIHTWKRKCRPALTLKIRPAARLGRRTSRQIELPFGGNSVAPEGASTNT